MSVIAGTAITAAVKAEETSVTLTGTAFTADLYTKWLAYIDVKPKSVSTYTRSIKQFMNFLHDNEISRPTRQDVINYREQLKETHKPATVQSYITAVKLFFQWCEQEKLYEDISKHIKGAKIEQGHKKDYMSAKQVSKVLKGIDTEKITGLRDYAILALLATTGLRTCEVQRANIEDMRTRGEETVLYIQGKGRDEKTDFVKLAEPVEDAIRAYLTRRGSVKGSEPLFASHAHRNDGGRMTTRSLSRIAKESLVQAGYNSDRLTAHSFRHTAATLNLLNGASIAETQQLLRHTNINTTMIYAHDLERAKNDSESRIASAIFEGKGK